MCDPVSAVIGSAVLGAGVSMHQGAKARGAAKEAQRQNEKMAATQAQRAEHEFNRLNQKQPGIAALLANNKVTTGKGIGSTFLTGSKGAPLSALQLGGAPTLMGA